MPHKIEFYGVLHLGKFLHFFISSKSCFTFPFRQLYVYHLYVHFEYMATITVCLLYFLRTTIYLFYMAVPWLPLVDRLTTVLPLTRQTKCCDLLKLFAFSFAIERKIAHTKKITQQIILWFSAYCNNNNEK